MPGRSIRPFTVLPCLPDRLQPLQTLAYNLWWSWNADAVALFRRVNPDLFEALDHSPIRLLGATDQSRFEQLEQDDGFLAHMDRVAASLDHYLKAPTWFQETHAADSDARIAYFSAEFGIHESVPVYSGGLGVLAGDHLKSASDLGIPLTGVSLMYREGYFRQYLNVDGWQQERYPRKRLLHAPAERRTRPRRQTAQRHRRAAGRELALRVWHIQVGRVPLYLLDANIPENSPQDRGITSQLYGGDLHTRHSTGDRAGHRRHPRAAGARQDADRMPHERGPRRIYWPGARAPADRGTQTRLPDRVRGGEGRNVLHDAHAGSGR